MDYSKLCFSSNNQDNSKKQLKLKCLPEFQGTYRLWDVEVDVVAFYAWKVPTIC